MTITYAIVVLCAFVLALLIYRYDMYDREPWYLMLMALVLGGFSAWCVGFVEDGLIVRLKIDESILGISINAALCEEACKVVIILFVAFGFRKHFNDPMDGIVYGALAGLGFALEESRFYLSLMTQMVPQPTRLELFGQESIRLILHFVTGGLDGFGIGLLLTGIKQWRVILPSWLAASIIIHALWDFACGLPQSADATFQRSIAVLLMLFGLALFGVAIYVGNQWSRVIHPPSEPSPHKLVRWPFTLLLRHEVRTICVTVENVKNVRRETTNT